LKKAIILAAFMVLVLSAVPMAVHADGEDQFMVDKALHWIDCPTAGQYTIQLIITNKAGYDKVFGVSSDWWNYTTVDPGEEWIDPSWVTQIVPEEQILPNNGMMIVNVTYSIPESAMNKRFKTWLRVYDSPTSLDKAITVIIRTGDKIPKMAYSVTPGSYRLRVFGTGAEVILDDANDKNAPPIMVRSECNVESGFFASAETPGNDIVISADSAIPHSEDEVGLSFAALSTEEARLWFTSDFTIDNPLVIPPFSKGYITWKLAVPDEVPNGHYAMGIRVEPAEMGAGVGINYVIWLLVEIDRSGSSIAGTWLGSIGNWIRHDWPFIVGIGLLIALGIVAAKKLQKPRKRRRTPGYRRPVESSYYHDNNREL
jgi:hypothetical protein